MMQISARVLAAGLAPAIGVERLFAQFIYGAAQLEFSMRGEDNSALGQLRWDNAVEHVDAAVHAFENVDGRAHAHQITR